jgi:GNAT superfamily N-acetyltransferase
VDNENKVDFYKLQWDSNYFNVECAKSILHKPLTKEQWFVLKNKFTDYQFISIENKNSEPTNSQLICTETVAFLIDVNIQFNKKIENYYEIAKGSETIEIIQKMKTDKRIIEMANFKVSKFTEDPYLFERGGNEVYKKWLINSFNKKDKYFAISRDINNDINGFLLYSYLDKKCFVELITVSNKDTNIGIGSKLFNTVEYEAYKFGCNEIKVGTQVRNIEAINFYHKVGCKMAECHQIYHLWNKCQLSTK